MATHSNKQTPAAPILENQAAVYALLDTPSDSIIVIDLDGVIQFVNETFATTIGREIDELFGASIWDLFPPEQHAWRKKIIDKAIDTGESVRVEDILEYGAFDTSIKPIFDSNQEVALLAIFAHEITNRKELEARLKENQEITRLLLDATDEIALLLDSKGTILQTNRAFAQLMGQHTDQLVGKSLWEMLPADAWHNWANLHEQVFADGQPRRMEEKSGDLIFDVQISPIANSSGETIKVAVLARNISEQKLAEDIQRRDLELTKLLVDAPTDMSIVIDTAGKLLMASDSFAQRTGRSLEDLIGMSLWTLFPPEIIRQRQAIFNEILRTGKPIRFEDQREIGDGPNVIYDAYAYPVFDERGDIVQIAVIARDITKRKLDEDNLKENFDLLKLLINAPTDIVLMTDSQGKLLMANDTFATRIGLPLENLIGKKLEELFTPEAAKRRRQHFDELIRTNKPQRFEELSMLGEYPPIIYDTLIYPIHNLAGEIAQIAVIARDITDLYKTQEELRNSKEQIEVILKGIGDGVTVWDREGNMIYNNDKSLWLHSLNQEGENISFDAIPDLMIAYDEDGVVVPPEEYPSKQAMQGVQIGPQIFNVHNLALNEDKWVIINATPIFDQSDQVQLVVTITQDITQIREHEQEIKRAKAQLEVILDSVTDGIHAWDANGKLIFANQTAAEMSGHATAESMLADPNILSHIELLDDDNNPIPPESYPGHLARKGLPSEPLQARLRTKGSQDERWTIIKAAPITDQSGIPQMSVVVTQDITELKKSEQELEHRVQERTAELGRLNQELRQEIDERKRAQEHSRQQADRARALVRIAARLSAQLDINAVLQIVCEEAVRIVDIPYAMILLYDPESDALHMVASHGRQELPDIINISIPRYQIERLINTERPTYVISDVQNQTASDYPELFWKFQMRTAIIAGMFHEQVLVGMLHLFSLGDPSFITKDELILLRALANQAAVAITNARLFEQVTSGQQRLHSLSQQLIDVQENERRKIARELHDEMGQVLTYLKILLTSIASAAKSSADFRESSHNDLKQANKLVDQLILKVRELSLDLRPGVLDDLGLLPALLAHIGDFAQRTHIHIDFKHNGLEQGFSPEIETTIFRIVQESLTNIARHAKTDEVTIRAWTRSGKLNLVIKDHGKGFDLQTIGRTGGLTSMQERAALCGGVLEIETAPNQGTSLIAEIPI